MYMQVHYVLHATTGAWLDLIVEWVIRLPIGNDGYYNHEPSNQVSLIQGSSAMEII